jgi:hypothetical protein
MVLRRQIWKAVLILLAVIGTVSSQTASFASHQSHQHLSHCCGVCHIGHLPLLDAADKIGFVPPSQLCWHRPADDATYAMESQVVLNLSRAPPV